MLKIASICAALILVAAAFSTSAEAKRRGGGGGARICGHSGFGAIGGRSIYVYRGGVGGSYAYRYGWRYGTGRAAGSLALPWPYNNGYYDVYCNGLWL
jgi:hypothetical protein